MTVMATAITFPVQFPSDAVRPDSALPVDHRVSPFPVRRHRLESEADRADRRGAIGRHPSSRPLNVSLVPAPSGVSISCADCQFQGTSACQDCIVTFVCGSIVQLGTEEARALRSLQEVGLLPMSQHAPVSVSEMHEFA